MMYAIAYAMTLLMTQPIFCNETLAWDGSGLAIGYVVTVSFEGPDGKLYSYTQREKEAKATLLLPYGRECHIIVGALFQKNNGDVYTLSSEPLTVEGCASRKHK